MLSIFMAIQSLREKSDHSMAAVHHYYLWTYKAIETFTFTTVSLSLSLWLEMQLFFKSYILWLQRRCIDSEKEVKLFSQPKEYEGGRKRKSEMTSGHSVAGSAAFKHSPFCSLAVVCPLTLFHLSFMATFFASPSSVPGHSLTDAYWSVFFSQLVAVALYSGADCFSTSPIPKVSQTNYIPFPNSASTMASGR